MKSSFQEVFTKQCFIHVFPRAWTLSTGTIQHTLGLMGVHARGRRRQWHPTPVLLSGESQGQRSLVGCRLWGRTESDTTEATQQQQQQHARDMALFSQYICDPVAPPVTLHHVVIFAIYYCFCFFSLSPPTSASVGSLELQVFPDSQTQEGHHILVMLFAFSYVLILSSQLNCKLLQVMEYQACKQCSINVYKQMPPLLCTLVLYLAQSKLSHCCCWRGHKSSMMEFIGSQVEKAEEIAQRERQP